MLLKRTKRIADIILTLVTTAKQVKTFDKKHKISSILEI